MGETDEVVLDGVQELFEEGALHFLEHVEGDRCHFVRVADGHRFRSGGTCMDDRRCARIGWGHSRCRREGYLYGGGEVKEQVVQLAAS